MGEFDQIYATYAAAVFRHALKCVGRRDVAEDITSEVFLTLHRERSGIDARQLPG
jgi:RNA polymerase sigma-70 factor (ECF subfamily)